MKDLSFYRVFVRIRNWVKNIWKYNSDFMGFIIAISRKTKQLLDNMTNSELFKTRKNYFWISFYFFIASIAFDYTRDFFQILITESSFQQVTGIFFYVNSVIFIVSLIILLFVRNIINLMVLQSLLYGSAGFLIAILDSIGIIAITWHGIYGFFVGLSYLSFLFFEGYEANLNNSFEHKNDATAVILNLKDDLWSLLKIVIQFSVAFIAITGVCMSILFGPEFDSLDSKLSAIRMVVGFAFCMGAIFIWFAKPLIKFWLTFRKNGF